MSPTFTLNIELPCDNRHNNGTNTSTNTSHFKIKLFEKKERKVDPSSSAAIYSKKLKNRNSLNIKRKFTHAAFGFLFAALNHMIPRERFVIGMILLTCSTLFMEMMRYRKGFGWMNDALHFVLGSSLRKHDIEGKFTGSFYYFLGVTITSAFPKPPLPWVYSSWPLPILAPVTLVGRLGMCIGQELIRDFLG